MKTPKNRVGPPPLHLGGKRFGMLVATNKLRGPKGTKQRLCYCDCGKKTWVRTSHLTHGNVKSCGCWNGKLALGQAARNVVLYRYKYDAKKRGLCWKLTDSQFNKLTSKSCFFCGLLPSNVKRIKHCHGNFVYSGIDRLNNKLGYTLKNTAPCCKECNQAKRDLSLNKFLAWIKRLRTS